MKKRLRMTIPLGLALLAPAGVVASETGGKFIAPNPTEVPAAIICLVIFLLSYLFVMTEEKTHLRKS